MAEVISEIIGEMPADLTPEQIQAVLTSCAALIPVLAVLFIDFIRDIFSGICRG